MTRGALHVRGKYEMGYAFTQEADGGVSAGVVAGKLLLNRWVLGVRVGKGGGGRVLSNSECNGMVASLASDAHGVGFVPRFAFASMRGKKQVSNASLGGLSSGLTISVDSVFISVVKDM